MGAITPLECDQLAALRRLSDAAQWTRGSMFETASSANKRQRQRRLLFQMQDGRCCYCGCAMVSIEGDIKPYPKNLTTLEHIDSRLSSLRGTFSHSNMRRHALACLECKGRGGRAHDAGVPAGWEPSQRRDLGMLRVIHRPLVAVCRLNESH
jgi:hypothetical protein